MNYNFTTYLFFIKNQSIKLKDIIFFKIDITKYFVNDCNHNNTRI